MHKLRAGNEQDRPFWRTPPALVENMWAGLILRALCGADQEVISLWDTA